MSTDLRLVLVIVFSMAIGAAGTLMWLFIPADHESPVVWNAAGASAFAVVGWVLTLSRFARRVERENPSELIWPALGAASMSLLAAAFLCLSSDTWHSKDWPSKTMIGTASVLAITMLPFRLRGITVKHANKRASPTPPAGRNTRLRLPGRGWSRRSTTADLPAPWSSPGPHEGRRGPQRPALRAEPRTALHPTRRSRPAPSPRGGERT